ncbi:MAG TPA: FadR/GntR family transcriptional regulator [Roseiarcus sp.]|jgi:DNA-binding FadR family transcriptional regulator
MPIQPIDSRRLYEQVADQIGALIRSGEFLPGQRLPAERDLAKILSVSRPVVREAMIALEITGLVEVRTGSGAYVREQRADQPPPDAGHGPSDILSARMLIEGEIAALAASSASPRDVAAMGDCIDQMTHDHEAERPWNASDLGFHVAIAFATGNAALASVVERLWQEQHAPVFSILSERVSLHDNWPATLNGHKAILEAIRAREPKAAKDRMREHLQQVLDVITGEADGHVGADAASPNRYLTSLAGALKTPR